MKKIRKNIKNFITSKYVKKRVKNIESNFENLKNVKGKTCLKTFPPVIKCINIWKREKNYSVCQKNSINPYEYDVKEKYFFLPKMHFFDSN